MEESCSSRGVVRLVGQDFTDGETCTRGLREVREPAVGRPRQRGRTQRVGGTATAESLRPERSRRARLRNCGKAGVSQTERERRM